MRFYPRHYVLLAVILALGVWNLVRLNRARHPALSPAANTPGWQAFDHAAALRDAPDTQFTPAVDALRAQTEAATGPGAADLRGCQMWLFYYRHNVPMAGGKPGDMAMMAASHVQSCITNHRDIGR